MSNGGSRSGCLWWIVVLCAVIGCWFPAMFYIVAVILVIKLFQANRKHNRLEAERLDRERAEAELEELRRTRVAELLQLVLEKDYPAFRTLLDQSYEILLAGEIVRLQEAFIRILESDGLNPIACEDVIAAGTPCYYKYEVQIAQQRQSEGCKYIDYDHAVTTTLYVFEQTVELVSTGHRTIKLKDILKILVGTEENTMRLMSLTLRNTGAPVLIVCPDALVLEFIIRTLQTLKK